MNDINTNDSHLQLNLVVSNKPKISVATQDFLSFLVAGEGLFPHPSNTIVDIAGYFTLRDEFHTLDLRFSINFYYKLGAPHGRRKE